MVDLHCHILPGIDDGAADAQQSKEMLDLQKSQGVSGAVLTSHFYPETVSFEEFLDKRDEAYDKIKATSPILLKRAAEVAYTRHLANLGDIEKLCIEDTQYLLLELPFSADWTTAMIDDIQRMSANFGVTFIIAHIELYPAAHKNFDLIKKLRDIGCLFQIDTQSVMSMSLTEKMFLKKLFRHGCFHFLASDCHNTTTRKPNLHEGFIKLGRLLGEDAVDEIKNNANIIFLP